MGDIIVRSLVEAFVLGTRILVVVVQIIITLIGDIRRARQPNVPR